MRQPKNSEDETKKVTPKDILQAFSFNYNPTATMIIDCPVFITLCLYTDKDFISLYTDGTTQN